MQTSAPAPFRQFVLKAHSRCDLACDHCYMYEHADQSWMRRPKVLTSETAALAGARIAEHARAHALGTVRIILHGGEPLLAGARHLEEVIRILRTALDGVADLDLRIHTNGVTLDEEFCELFSRYDVKVGVSLDGDRAANDRHRRYADGRTSHPKVLRALELLRRPAYRHLYAGILCTIDVENDPIAVYEALLAERPPRVDLLLPHATWDAPPPRPPADDAGLPEAAPYAAWLTAIYDRWLADGRPMGIRVFDSVLSTLHGGPPLTEALGLLPSDVLVIETDGDIEQVDSLKIAFDGAPATGLTLRDAPLDAASLHPGIRARQHGLSGLCQTCQSCPVVESCGGGLYAHRYRSGNGWDNPSVHCEDLKRLIVHIDGHRPASTIGSEPHHHLELRPLDELARGFGGADAVADLAAIQDSLRRRLLVDAAVRLMEVDPALRSVWNLITELDAAHGDTLAAVTAHPYFRSWAVRVLEGEPRPADTDYLATVAVAAAVRSGSEIELSLPARDHAVYLPTLGRLRTDADRSVVKIVAGSEPGSAMLWSDGESHVIAADGSTLGHGRLWEPARILRASDDFSVRLECLDPERGCHQWPVADALSADEADRWQRFFDEAWRTILRDHAVYAPGLRAGLTTLTPLAHPEGGRDISAAARQAPWAIAAALPATASHLALLLMHEFQHVKLGAVLDGYDLYDETDHRLFYAPWRNDPRPLEGLLQGTYAHVAVADYWRVRRTVAGGAEADTADMQFARWRTHTIEAIEVLASSGSLTTLGDSFVDGMRATVSPWLDEPVSAKARDAARELSAGHLEAYRTHLAGVAAS